jgi:hypothetical protein
MQVVSHSLTHRGRSASRTRARWQPYASIQPPSMRTPSSAYLHTPASSTVSTPAPALHNSICESEPSKPPTRSNSLILSQPSKDIRDVHKHKYVTGLVGEFTEPLSRNPAHAPILEPSRLLRRAFLSTQMPPSGLCVRYGTPMISPQCS